MMIITHALAGLVIGLLIRYPIYFLIGSVIPDLDLLFSLFSPIEHRSAMHSVSFAIVSFLLVFAAKGDWKPATALAGGIVFHIILDLFTFQNIDVFYPLDLSYSLNWIHTKNILPNVLIWIAYSTTGAIWWKNRKKFESSRLISATITFLFLTTLLIVYAFHATGVEWLLGG